MPIFNNEITFIHIPKSGGTTIEKFLQSKGYKMSLFTSTGSIFINGHTPQHCTYRELNELNLLTDKMFTIVRPETERVLSEYFYILEKRPDLKKLFTDFDSFLELFLDEKNSLLFDNHNLSNNDFLINSDGLIDERIKIFDFFDIRGLEEYLGITGLNSIHEMKTIKKNILTNEHVNKIKKSYEK